MIDTKELKNRINNFLEELGVPKTEFCQRVNISTQSLRLWMKDELSFSETTLNRIDNFLAKYNF